MEVSALKYSGGIGLHARSPLLRLQSDERLVALVRRGNNGAFEALVSRFETRLQAFCRHLLGSREDAEDVLQEVLAAAYNAMLADERPINVKPWLYRIARNRSLNHLRRSQAIGVDSMDVHLSDHGQSTADKVHEREEFQLLVGDIHGLPESQRTALVLREMDALSYEHIAEAMETTVPSVKSLLVRARVSLAEAAEARLLSCEEVRVELGEVAEGLQRRPSPLVRRHLRSCTRCSSFRAQLRENNKALAAVLPLGPLVILKKLVLTHLGHLGHSAGSGATSAGAAGSTAAAGGSVMAGSTAGGFVSAGLGAIATKAAAGLAAAALVTGAAVEVDHATLTHHQPQHSAALPAAVSSAPPTHAPLARAIRSPVRVSAAPSHRQSGNSTSAKAAKTKLLAAVTPRAAKKVPSPPARSRLFTPVLPHPRPLVPPPATPAVAPGRTQTQKDPTVLAPAPQTVTTTATPTHPDQSQLAPVEPAPGTGASTTPTPPAGTPPSSTTPTH
ncbi:MAG: RNA polymerase sigma factor [Actinomycetota bacterium]|nr:RNA polymerase sigma factor [Actinomycetota bacterium]